MLPAMMHRRSVCMEADVSQRFQVYLSSISRTRDKEKTPEVRAINLLFESQDVDDKCVPMKAVSPKRQPAIRTTIYQHNKQRHHQRRLPTPCQLKSEVTIFD
ncbi:hypothetical protein KIN20_007300 [Parelaphostrongylus tenuis]|uniref:Uncharacterized protein n=1 Tax=Parelaphostrongylus tenuis TaxID=148309 RepID=A0AAD5MVC3_PARTN|nr:hypothetical protein KIN20_007300 [Parelaphostrongylus tenuis]